MELVNRRNAYENIIKIIKDHSESIQSGFFTFIQMKAQDEQELHEEQLEEESELLSWEPVWPP
jgi:hypothetical protein